MLPTQSRPFGSNVSTTGPRSPFPQNGKQLPCISPLTFSTDARMIAPPNISSAMKNCPANGPNLPPVASYVTPLIEWAQPYGTHTVVFPNGFCACCFCCEFGNPYYRPGTTWHSLF